MKRFDAKKSLKKEKHLAVFSFFCPFFLAPLHLCAFASNIFLFFALNLSVHAQDVALTYDLPVQGTLDADTPRLTYSFDGMRGEVISLSLRVTAGDLDPTLVMVDDDGEILTVQNSPDFISIPRSARYTIIVGRFGMALGTTSGTFELSIAREGVSFASGSALRYGDSVYNTITDMTPQIYYSFRAGRGDVMSVRMQRVSGDLDPFLQVVNSQGVVISENDDVIGAGSLDAAVTALLIEQDGMYAIIASRFGQAAGRSRGSFVLTLETASGSGLGSRAEAAFPLLAGETVEGDITADRSVQFYRFTGVRDEIISVTMSRTEGNLDTLIVLADANLSEIVSDDDGGGGQNSALRDVVLPTDGTYYLIATRYQRSEGTTEGTYALSFASAGSAFQGAAEGTIRIAYGTTVTGRIDDETNTLLYAFYGREGDVITVSMSRADGDLDSFISLLDSNRSPLSSNDDGGNGQDARLNQFTLPSTGIYYIAATRFGGQDRPPTRGSFILVLARLGT